MYLRLLVLAALGALMAFQGLALAGSSRPELEALRSPDPEVRWNAVLNLGARREASSLEALVTALDDPHPNVSDLACWALGRLGDPRAVPSLVRHLARSLNDDPLVLPPMLIDTLGRLGDPRALPTLVEVLFESPDTGDREAALEALAMLRGVEAGPILLALQDDRDENVRLLALEKLAESPHEAALPLLEECGRDGDPRYRRAAARGMGRLGRPGIPALELLACDPDGDVTLEARAALAQAQSGADPRDPGGKVPVSEEAQVAGETLSLSLRDLRAANFEDHDPPFEAPLALARAEKLREADLLQLLDASDPRVRGNAVLCLGNRSTVSEPGLARLVALLDDPDSGIRWKAAKALGKLDHAGAVEALLQAARDEDKDVREDAVEALARLSGAETRPRVMAQLRCALDDPWPSVRQAAALRLEAVPGEGAHELLLRALQDPDGLVRLTAARSLALRGDGEAEEALLRLQQDPSRKVRYLARRLWAAGRPTT